MPARRARPSLLIAQESKFDRITFSPQLRFDSIPELAALPSSQAKLGEADLLPLSDNTLGNTAHLKQPSDEPDSSN